MIGSWMFFGYPHPLAGDDTRPRGRISKQEWKYFTDATVIHLLAELERLPPHLLSSL